MSARCKAVFIFLVLLGKYALDIVNHFGRFASLHDVFSNQIGCLMQQFFSVEHGIGRAEPFNSTYDRFVFRPINWLRGLDRGNR